MPGGDLLAPFEAELRSYLRARLGAVEAEDVLQTTMLRALEHLAELRDESAVRGWLYQIARRAMVDTLRKKGREMPQESMDVLLAGADAEQTWDTTANEPCGCASALHNTLSAGQAELLRMVDMEETSLKSAADCVGSSVNAANVRLHRARKRLRERLFEHCGIEDYRSAMACDCASASCVET